MAAPNTTSAAAPAEKAPAEKDSGNTGTKYLNTTNTPLIYDGKGHQVDAHAWTPAITLDTIGRSARKAGLLLPASAL